LNLRGGTTFLPIQKLPLLCLTASFIIHHSHLLGFTNRESGRLKDALMKQSSTDSKKAKAKDLGVYTAEGGDAKHRHPASTRSVREGFCPQYPRPRREQGLQINCNPCCKGSWCIEGCQGKIHP